MKGKTVLVTGGAAGFGEAIVRRFAQEGAHVVAMDMNGAGAEAVAGSVGGTAVQGDVTVRADVARAVKVALERNARIDLVVNNAGWSNVSKPLEDVTDEEFDRLFSVNVKSIYLMTQEVAPGMRAAGGGAIINVGSTAGIRPRPGMTWYCASKGAVNVVSQAMAVELAPYGIRVNCVAPVAGNTGLLSAFLGKPDTPENRAGFISSIPLGRLCEPSDVAAACMFLASDDAEFLTGVVLPVDGGRTV